ncbi:MAG: cyclopropane fatty-acyl-phospholipid synthase-like methyltransferase [Candidatus Endobugula sp.]|jgi:cyclopropane fatty-acyl-phospholipid synthase-like methyltransferase
MLKPFSQACINNRDAILHQLQRLLVDSQWILEVGSGTGQHAVYFSHALPHLNWQTSDLEENHQGINEWVDEAPHKNCLKPLVLDVTNPVWPSKQYDAVFTANTLHICSWQQVELFFQHATQSLKPNGYLIVYGPFKYAGEYTSESNARFDQFLKATHPGRGIRDIEKLTKLAIGNSLALVEDQAMPANNRLLVFKQC